MGQIERVYKIDKALKGRVAPNKRRLLDLLEVSEATLKRDIEYMRSRLGAPICWSREARGYRYDLAGGEFALPGLWFSADEFRALLVITSVIDHIQPGFLHDQIAPFRKRLKELADQSTGKADSFSGRVSFIATPLRLTNPDCLETIACGTLTRRRVEIEYETRSRGVTAKRITSPARLIYYRNQWYMDAWCHSANAKRRFAIDAVLSARIINKKAREIRTQSSRTGFGIFSGRPIGTAVLKFRESAARWIRTAQWHEDQKLALLPDGAVSLAVPYSHTQEILMEILRYGADVEVLAPAELRASVAAAHQDAASIYRQPRRAPAREAGKRLKSAVAS